MNILISAAGRRVSLVNAFKKIIKEKSLKSKVFTTDYNPRINSSASHFSDDSFEIGSFKLNSKLRFLTHNNETQIKLSPKENELLRLLALHVNDLMPREIALTKIWRDDNYFTSRSMDVYIAKLRKYLKLDPKVEILNIHGEGFRLVINP